MVWQYFDAHSAFVVQVPPVWGVAHSPDASQVPEVQGFVPQPAMQIPVAQRPAGEAQSPPLPQVFASQRPVVVLQTSYARQPEAEQPATHA